jgi:hypothetical protein
LRNIERSHKLHLSFHVNAVHGTENLANISRQRSKRLAATQENFDDEICVDHVVRFVPTLQAL